MELLIMEKEGLWINYNNDWFQQKCMKSVKFRETGDLIELKVTKNRENTENCHEIVLFLTAFT